MIVHALTTPGDFERYDAWVKAHPDGSLWQSLAWKTFQEALGREVRVYVAEEAGAIVSSALVTIDRTAFGLNTWDCARGPLAIKNDELRIKNELTKKIIDNATKDKAIALYMSPQKEFLIHNSQFLISQRHIHPEATLHIDLTRSDEDILAGMHPKGRYNIKVARNHKVDVRLHKANDAAALDAFYGLLNETGGRDGFTILHKAHYRTFLERLHGSFFLMAWHDGKPVAGLLGVVWNGIGIYYYGASSYAHRALMAPSLLQWEAMTYCKARGCHVYDLLGISPVSTTGISEKSATQDPWHGITDFKRKFGGTVMIYPPEREIALRPMAKKLLKWKRKMLG